MYCKQNDKLYERHYYEKIPLRMPTNPSLNKRNDASLNTYLEPRPRREKPSRPLTAEDKFKKDKRLLTAAIDFGTTYSGYAYSFVNEPTKVYINYWKSKIARAKTPTVLLLNPDKSVAAFGEDAQEKYLKLVKEKQAENWYYFENFKMELYSKQPPLAKDMTIEDISGKSVLALDVFSASIKYLKNHLLEVLNGKEEYVSILENDIHWVLTVPAIWNDSSKQFMREAAKEAGIENDSLTIALEPEVASIYCKAGKKHSVYEKKDSDRIGLDKTKTKYMVLDLGGGTADITCHEVLDDGNLAELYHATGGNYGGANINEAFRQFLIKIFGMNVIREFQTLYLEEYLELFTIFERKKKYFENNFKVRIPFPFHLLELYKSLCGVEEMPDVANIPGCSDIKFHPGKITIPSNYFKTFFDTAVSNIIQQVSELLEDISDISYIIMVGGFSESPYVYSRMQQQFGERVIRAMDPSSTIMKGAVLFGEHHTIITRRISKYSYGIARMMRFKPEIHRPEKIKYINGLIFVDDVFNSHIEVGQSIDIGQDVEGQEYFPAMNGLTQAVLEVYASKNRNPQYVTDEGCFHVGLITIDLSPYEDHRRWPLCVKILFGGTELTVDVLEVKTNKHLEVTLSLVH
ncbi:hypothetical protein ACJMK2_005534 [Sinanodonta woodiana]|uniref:Heat shock 70 kDa protein 12A n=1 Tax=Sinanodonta woodiana TaxID=1069815 RepID=A0ABD3VQQ1_SINWO